MDNEIQEPPYIVDALGNKIHEGESVVFVASGQMNLGILTKIKSFRTRWGGLSRTYQVMNMNGKISRLKLISNLLSAKAASEFFEGVLRLRGHE